jgi:SAM-dependent methyltransferase
MKGHHTNEQQPTETNRYSTTWFELFLAEPDPFQTAREVAFLTRVLPPPDPSSILDLCCGFGRHAGPLAKAGYRVLGVDRDPGVIARAQSLHRFLNLTFRVHDMTMLNALPGVFDAVVCMWQSFGYFDKTTNAAVLAQISGHLRPGGRVVLDIYNRAFFDQRQGTRSTQQRGEAVVTTQLMEDDQLVVTLDYVERQVRDIFAWQLFTPQSIAELAETCGLKTVLMCSNFREDEAPSQDNPRMQLVFEKR